MSAGKSKQLKGNKNHKEKNKLKTATNLKINAQGEKEVQVKNNDSISLKAYLTWSREYKGGEMLHVASICYYWVSRMREVFTAPAMSLWLMLQVNHFAGVNPVKISVLF